MWIWLLQAVMQKIPAIGKCLCAGIMNLQLRVLVHSTSQLTRFSCIITGGRRTQGSAPVFSGVQNSHSIPPFYCRCKLQKPNMNQSLRKLCSYYISTNLPVCSSHAGWKILGGFDKKEKIPVSLILFSTRPSFLDILVVFVIIVVQWWVDDAL